MNIRLFLKNLIVAFSAVALAGFSTHCFAANAKPGTQGRPNILWLSAEDISAHFGCFGDVHAKTPTIDKLAAEGVRYTRTYTTAGVCAPCRSGIITGVFQTTLGTHHMRCKANLPDNIRAFTTYLRDAGYYCSNNSKTDYQTDDIESKDAWDDSSSKAHWRNRQNDKPFFSVFNFTGCHEGRIASKSRYESETKDFTANQRQDPTKLTLPPYYPDTPIVREDWKRNYELITAMDVWANNIIEQLKADGLYENTIIFFWSDHGVGLPRAKRWVYESGTNIPLVIRIPEKYHRHAQGTPGSIDDQLVSSIDFAPTVLNLAGLNLPDYMQGRSFLGDNLTTPRQYVFAARDRMDERYDIIRGVRDKRYRYIRNYEPKKPYYQYMATPEKGGTMKEIRRCWAEGTLPPVAELFMADQKPSEEFYDLLADPYEVHNLAKDPAYQKELDRMRKVHLEWMLKSRDIGLIPEPEIIAREKVFGNRYDILRQDKTGKYNKELIEIATLASSGPSALDKLVAAINHDDAVIRYWGATGIGNIGIDAKSAENVMIQTLKDKSVSVRVAAARALCKMGKQKKAIPTLAKALESEYQWGRLQAAIVLDEMGELARPAIPVLQKASVDQPNKYIIRVAKHALNELNGTTEPIK